MIEGILITGLINWGAYTILAIGFSLVFGVARIMNLAHTAFYMIAAYLLYTFAERAGLITVLSIILSVGCATAVGIITYKAFVERVREHETTVVMITLLLAFAFSEVWSTVFGGTPRGVPPFFPGFQEVFGVRVLNQQLLTLGVNLIVVSGIWIILFRTKLGLAIRSTAQDREVANLMGISVPRICLITMAVTVALAAIAGVIVAPLRNLDPGMWIPPFLIIVAIVILGGMGSIKGSLVGAFILAFVEVLVVYMIPTGSFLREAVAVAVMVVVLLFKPEGLFGVVFEEERL